ncbi:nSTAND1 domain-containing NTPase [Amycolatopsis sp. NBC_01480]|uniref:nSTAND1 domain-containing NTPase n=1 Tax=Amycolatopsis sp. NBC_01480 TaxID=2903562 RepID=UPI002E29D49E|nr:hypothetical protein [Amycolatopsis sp. NBC_01480]
MPRRERPLDPGGDVLSQFAAGLRRLRERAGGPTYRELGQRAHYAAGTLSDAAGGRRLPTLAVALAYVRACHGDVGEWERRWHAVAAEVAGGGSVATEAAGEVAPYAGLVALQPADVDRFFGRDRLLDELDAKLAGHRFVAVVGASGAGKSSLLRAGLVPRLGAGAEVVLVSPGAHPLEECAIRLAPLVRSTVAAVLAELADDPRNLRRLAAQALTGRAEGAEFVLIVDQFEEAFTLCADPAERAGFLDALLRTTAAGSRMRIVVGMRADFYLHCAEHAELAAAVSAAQVLVGPMTTAELRDVIVQPAVHADCAVEGALLAELVAEAGGRPGVLPLLSHVLLETWRRRRGNTLTLAGYLAAGGIQGALAQTAEDIHADFDAGQQRLVKQLFLRLTTLGDGTGNTKRRIHRSELEPADDATGAVLTRLAEARLVTIDADTVDLTHESLVTAWPRLREWLTEDRESLRVHRRLTEATAVWESLGRDPGVLYRGTRLGIAKDRAGDLSLTAREREFLRASITADETDQAAARRRNRRLRQLVALLAVLLLLAAATTGYAVHAQNQASAERDIAISQRVAGQSDALRTANPALAAQLGLAAYRLAPTAEARGTVLSTFAAPYATQLTSHTDGVNALAFSPTRHLLATASDDRTARLWDVADPHHPRELATLDGREEVYSVAFSPDERILATAARDHLVRLWDITDPAHPRERAELAGHTDRVYSVAFSPDGRFVATAGEDHTIRLWNVTDVDRPQSLITLTDHSERVYQAVFSPDGRTLASASGDGTAKLWEVADPPHARLLATLTGHTDRVRAVAFSPDGRTLATASQDRTARLWDVADRSQPHWLATLTGHTDKVYSAVFSPDGRTLATAGQDRTVRTWDVTDPRNPHTGAVFTGHTEIVWSAVFSPDGRTLASSSWDRTVRLWDLADPHHPGPAFALAGSAGAVYSAAFSPDRRTAATGSADHTARLWDVADPAHPAELAVLTGHTGQVQSVAFSADGRLLATGSDDHTVLLWNVADRAHPRALATLTGYSNTVNAVVFSPDGRFVITASSDATVRLWDIADPASPHPLATLTGQVGPVYSAAVSPDGRIMATAGWDATVRLWDVTDPGRPRQLAGVTGHAGPVWSVAISPDGRTMATGGDDRTGRLWDITDAAHPQALSTLTGHTGHLYSVAFSPGGHTVATAGDDHTVRLWDVSDLRSPQFLAALTGHSNRVWSVAFGPDGHTAATASDDGTALLRETDLDSAARRICQTTPAITAADWHQFLPERAYQPPCP